MTVGMEREVKKCSCCDNDSSRYLRSERAILDSGVEFGFGKTGNSFALFTAGVLLVIFTTFNDVKCEMTSYKFHCLGRIERRRSTCTN